MSKNRIINVFIASPCDLAIERRAFKDTVSELNKGFGRGATVEFVPLGWEDALSQVGRRSQDVINQDIDNCDVFVLVMWRRWGQKAPDAKARGFGSYTEEEFYRALGRLEKTKTPTICTFFKHIDAGEMASPGPDLKKVLRFRKKLEQSKQVIWRGFKDEASFIGEIDKHLAAYAKGEIQSATEPISETLLPDSAIKELKKLRKEAKQAVQRAEKAEQTAKGATARAETSEKLAEARAAQKSVNLAEKAAKAALEGKLEEARQDFAKALDGTTNLRVLYLGFEFFRRIGELDEAERLLRRWLSVSGPEAQTADTAAAHGNLGMLELTRGNLDAAEAYLKKSLAINEKPGRLEGMANAYGNLGVIEQKREKLDAAEAYLKKSLSIYEKLGRLEGMAIQYCNHGAIAKQRANKAEARRLWKLSLDLFRKVGAKLRERHVQKWLDALGE